MVIRLHRTKFLAKLLLGAMIIGAGSTASAQVITFNSPLVDAANRGDEASVLLMLSQGYPVNSQGEYGVTPLMRAAYNGHLRIVKVLLGMGADVNATDIAGATALHVAARMGRQDVAEELLRYHANVDAADQEGWTPLMRAALAKNPGIVRLLLDNGADPFKVNSAGEYVLMQAVEVSSPEVVKVLVEKGVVTRDNPAVIAALGNAVRKDNPQVTNVLQSALTQPLPNTAAPVVPVTVENLPTNNRQPIAEQIVNSVEQPLPDTLPENTAQPYTAPIANNVTASAPVVSDKPAFAAFEEVKSLEEVMEEEKRIQLLKEKEKKANIALQQQQQKEDKAKASEQANAKQPALTPAIVQDQVSQEVATKPAKIETPSKEQTKIVQTEQPQVQAKAEQANATKPASVSNKRFFRLQAGMYTNQEEAKKAWDVFASTYPKIFSGQQNAIMALPDQTQTTYTLVFGQFPNKQSASKLCSTLWQKDIGCFVMETSLSLDQLQQEAGQNDNQLAETPVTAPVTPAAPFNVADAIQEEKVQEEAKVQSGKPDIPPLPEGAILVTDMPWLQAQVPVSTALPDASNIDSQKVIASGEEMAMREEMRPAPQKKAAPLKAKEKLQPKPAPKQVATAKKQAVKEKPTQTAVTTTTPATKAEKVAQSATAKVEPVKKGKVEIAEAIRVQPGQKITLPDAPKKTSTLASRKPAKAIPTVAPVITHEPTPAKPTTSAAKPEESLSKAEKPKLVETSLTPKAAVTGNVESYWIQVGNFANQQTAIEFAKVIRQNPSFRGSRLRVVRLPAAAAKNEPAIALQLGNFTSEAKAKSLCKEGLSYLRCSVIKEVQSEIKG